MDNNIALKAEGLSKKFLIAGGLKEKNLANLFSKRRTVRGMDDDGRTVDGNFWALRDINLEVYKGETIGVIGANGAGKTTLLKVFSKILKQNEGTYTINGRVSSLIGVGTGFHQELTGRENVYFNGALLGMKKSEIDKRFEEIVEFAEVANFIDSPIKFYSSGMRSRLAFSVAMSLDAEIMIIDEALSVGDTAFREKSTQKMRDTAFTGRTVFFVTHSMSYMQEVCDRSFLLDKGRITAEGKTEDVVDIYLNSNPSVTGPNWKAGKQKVGDKTLSFEKLDLITNDRITKSKTHSDSDSLGLKISFHSTQNTKLYSVGYSIFDTANQRLWTTRQENTPINKGVSHIIGEVPSNFLKPGDYTLALDVEKRSEGLLIDPYKTSAKLSFNIHTNRGSDLHDLHDNGGRSGIIRPQITWRND